MGTVFAMDGWVFAETSSDKHCHKIRLLFFHESLQLIHIENFVTCQVNKILIGVLSLILYQEEILRTQTFLHFSPTQYPPELLQLLSLPKSHRFTHNAPAVKTYLIQLLQRTE